MTSNRFGWARSLGLAAGATAVFGLALGVANGVSTVGAVRWDWPRLGQRIVQAGLCSAITLIGILALARWARIRVSWFGLRRSGAARDVATGLVVVSLAALVVFGLATAAGAVVVTAVRPGALIWFLLTTVVVATGFEAFPEELAFRGLAFSSLRERLPIVLAAAAATVVFAFNPGVSDLVSGAIIRAFHAGEPPWYSLAPGGQDPVVYVTFLVIWSICLICARLVSGSIWTGVAAHLLMLIVNRLVLDPTNGVQVQLVGPDAILLLPAYVLLAALGFTLVRAYRNRRDRRVGSPTVASVESRA